MRALLVVNPRATTTTARVRDVLAGALRHELDLRVEETTARGDATVLAAKARAAGTGLVIALGGDGTVNEVVNGLLEHGPGPGVPDLAIVPGGNANVLVRNLGLPVDPVEATGELLSALRTGRRRTIGLGRANGRWFTFAAGLGLDAAVVHRVEHLRDRGRRASTGLYARAAVRAYTGAVLTRPAARPSMRVHLDGGETIEGAGLVIVANCSPWTYLDGRPLRPAPDADFDAGLDVVALTGLGPFAASRLVVRVLRGRSAAGPGVSTAHDLSRLRVDVAGPAGGPGGAADAGDAGTRDSPDRTAPGEGPAEPPPPLLQVDGDEVGPQRTVEFVSVPGALRVVA